MPWTRRTGSRGSWLVSLSVARATRISFAPEPCFKAWIPMLSTQMQRKPCGKTTQMEHGVVLNQGGSFPVAVIHTDQFWCSLQASISQQAPKLKALHACQCPSSNRRPQDAIRNGVRSGCKGAGIQDREPAFASTVRRTAPVLQTLMIHIPWGSKYTNNTYFGAKSMEL